MGGGGGGGGVALAPTPRHQLLLPPRQQLINGFVRRAVVDMGYWNVEDIVHLLVHYGVSKGDGSRLGTGDG